MRRALAILIVGCGHPPPVVHDVRQQVIPLEVIVLDDFPVEDTCDRVAPRKLHVSLDGRDIGVAVVPCRTKITAPPLQFPVPAVQVTAGWHVVRVLEPETETSAEAKLSFPLFDPPYGEAEDDQRHELATKLPVWATDTEIEIQAPRARLEL